MRLLDGKAASAALLEEVKAGVAALGGPQPAVAFVRVGEDPASVSYVKAKGKRAAEVGIESHLHVLPEETPAAELFALLDRLNADPAVHGILVQQPLPKQIPTREVVNYVDVAKDVDGFSDRSLGRLVQGDPDAMMACTPAGVIQLLRHYRIASQGKHVVIVGRSIIVGKPLAQLFLQRGEFADATVTVCHSRTQSLASHLSRADIVVAALGSPEFIRGEHLREGSTVIDVGINRVEDASAKRGYRLVGDVHFPSASERVEAITPVPGGVGPMTIAVLLQNTLRAYQTQNRREQP